jgi:hypothetical protein
MCKVRLPESFICGYSPHPPQFCPFGALIWVSPLHIRSLIIASIIPKLVLVCVGTKKNLPDLAGFKRFVGGEFLFVIG